MVAIRTRGVGATHTKEMCANRFSKFVHLIKEYKTLQHPHEVMCLTCSLMTLTNKPLDLDI
jgi:hypothetical protein